MSAYRRGCSELGIGLQKEGVRRKYTHTIKSAHTLHAQFDKHLSNESHHKYISACLFTRRPRRMQRLANLQFSPLAMHWFLKPVDAWYVNIGSLCPNTSSRRQPLVARNLRFSPMNLWHPEYKILRTALVESQRKEQEKQQANYFKS